MSKEHETSAFSRALLGLDGLESKNAGGKSTGQRLHAELLLRMRAKDSRNEHKSSSLGEACLGAKERK